MNYSYYSLHLPNILYVTPNLFCELGHPRAITFTFDIVTLTSDQVAVFAHHSLIIFLWCQVLFPKFLGNKDPHDFVHLFHNFFRLLLEIFVDLELGLWKFLRKGNESLCVKYIFNLFEGFHTSLDGFIVFFKKIGFVVVGPTFVVASHLYLFWVLFFKLAFSFRAQVS